MSVAESIASIAWPLAVLIIALLFRTPLTEALQSASGTLTAGPLKFEWKRQAAAIEADLGRTPIVSRGKIDGAAGRIDEIAEDSPTGAIMESLGQIEACLRSVLEKHGVEGLDRHSSIRQLAEVAYEQGLITVETSDAIEGLSVMRNLAVHGGRKGVSRQQAHEFIALAQGVLFAIISNTKAAEGTPQALAE